MYITFFTSQVHIKRSYCHFVDCNSDYISYIGHWLQPPRDDCGQYDVVLTFCVYLETLLEHLLVYFLSKFKLVGSQEPTFAIRSNMKQENAL